MENITAIISLVTAIISLIAVIISLITSISRKKENKVPEISIRGKNNTINQDNRTLENITYTENKQVIYVSSGNTYASNDDGILILVSIGLLLFFLYTNRVILLQFIYVPLIISTFLGVLICIFSIKGFTLTPLHPSKIVNIIFAFIPVVISVLFLVQNILFLHDINSVESVHKLLIGATILFDYLGLFFLLFAQLCVLIVARVKPQKIKSFMINLSRIWPIATILPVFPIIIWFLLK